MLEARAVTIALAGRPVLQDVDLAIAPGEVLALAGPNGAGKSTLLAALSGARRPDRGAVLMDGAALGALTPAELALRRAVLEQHPSALDAFPLSGLVGLSIPIAVAPRAAAVLAQQAAAALGLSGLLDRPVGALSGGERHRAHMARALAQLWGGRALGQGRWLMLDEPTASLDPRHQGAVLRAARDAAASGAGVLVVLHDLTLAAQMADRVALMRDGRIVALGSPEEVLTPERLAAVYDIPMAVSAPAPGRLAITPLFS